MSVPRPAMLVEMVTAPGAPARATTAASSSSFLALRTSQGTPAAPRAAASSSDSLTLAVPTRTGRPAAWTPAISRTRAAELGLLVREHDVGEVAPDAGPVGRDDDDAQAVEFLELLGRRPGRGRHPAERRIEAEEVLERDGAEDAALGAAADALLGFDGGLEAVGPMALVHDPAGELVDDLDAAVADDVVDVPREEGLGVEGAVDGGQELLVLRGEEVAAAEQGFDPADARVRGEDVGVLRVGLVVLPRSRPRTTAARRAGVGVESAGGPGDDERDAGLVDEDGIGLVDEGRRRTAGGRDPPARRRGGRGGNRSRPPWPWRR